MKAKAESGDCTGPLDFIKFLSSFHAVTELGPGERKGIVWYNCTCGLFTERAVCHHALAIALDVDQGQMVGRARRGDFKGECMPVGVANADLFQKRGAGRPSTQQAIKDWVK